MGLKLPSWLKFGRGKTTNGGTPATSTTPPAPSAPAPAPATTPAPPPAPTKAPATKAKPAAKKSSKK